MYDINATLSVGMNTLSGKFTGYSGNREYCGVTIIMITEGVVWLSLLSLTGWRGPDAATNLNYQQVI